MRRLWNTISFNLRSCGKALVATGMLAFLACVGRIVVLSAFAGEGSADPGASPLFPPRLGDVLLWVLGGMMEVAQPQAGIDRMPMPDLPYHWLVIVLLPGCLLTLLPLGRRGFEQMLVASGSRDGAWLSAAVATTLIVICYWAVVVASCALATLVMHGSLALEAGNAAVRASGFYSELLGPPPYHVLAPLLCCVAASVALGLFQLALQVWFGSSMAWVAVVVLQLASILIFTPLLPGNLMMLARSSAVLVDHPIEIEGAVYHAGIRTGAALVVSLVLAAGAFVAGTVRMRRDLLRRD